MPAVTTAAAPKRAISRPAKSSEVIGHQQRSRRNHKAGLEGRPSPGRLFPQRDRQQHGAESRRIRRHDQCRTGELANTEQRGIDEGIVRTQTAPDEQREEDDRDGAAETDARRVPAPVVHLDDRKCQRGDTAGDQHRVKGIWPRCFVPGNFRKLPPADRHCNQADRNVDEEYPAPVCGHQQAADDRSERRREAADRGPRPHRGAAPIGRKYRQQQTQRGRRHQRRAGGLNHAKRDQGFDIDGGGAGRRCDGEQRHPEQEAQVPAVALGEAAEEHQQRRVGDRIAVQDPGHVLERGALEVPADIGQRHVDDEEIEIGEADAHADDRQYQGGRRRRSRRSRLTLAGSRKSDIAFNPVQRMYPFRRSADPWRYSPARCAIRPPRVFRNHPRIAAGQRSRGAWRPQCGIVPLA